MKILENLKAADVERRGEQYVSTEDEARSVALLEQVRFLKTKFQESLISDQAVAINPHNLINTYLVRCEAEPD